MKGRDSAESFRTFRKKGKKPYYQDNVRFRRKNE